MVCPPVCRNNSQALASGLSTLDGWLIDLRFTFFLTVFQSYQDDAWMIMKGCVQWNSFMIVKISPQVRMELSPLDQ